MEDKTQYEALVEELQKIVENFTDAITELGDILAKILPDIEIPEEEEDTWEMKCPFEYNDAYYWLTNNGNVEKCFFNTEIVDKPRFYQGSIFKTRQAAELEAKRRNLLTRFRAFRDECNGDWKPDFTINSNKYFIENRKGKIDVDYIWTVNSFILFGYFKNKEDAERAIEMFGDEIIELYVDNEV